MSALVTVLLAACTPDASDYSVGAVEGSLVPFFEDPLVCTCNISFDMFTPDRFVIQLGCSPDSETVEELGYDLTFYIPTPPIANLRERDVATVQVNSTAFGVAAAETEYGSETFTRDTGGDDFGLKRREVFLWVLDMPAQRVCDALDSTECMELQAGRVTDARFGCLEVEQ